MKLVFINKKYKTHLSETCIMKQSLKKQEQLVKAFINIGSSNPIHTMYTPDYGKQYNVLNTSTITEAL